MPSSRGSSQPRMEPASPVTPILQADSLLLSHWAKKKTLYSRFGKHDIYKVGMVHRGEKTLGRYIICLFFLHIYARCIPFACMWLCSEFHYYSGPSDLWKIFNGVMVTQWVSHILYSFPVLIQFRLNQSHCFPHCLLTLEQALVYPVKADWPCWGFGTVFQPFLLAPLLEWSNLQKTGWWPQAWSKFSYPSCLLFLLGHLCCCCLKILLGLTQVLSSSWAISWVH